jgi:hypothetical protein
VGQVNNLSYTLLLLNLGGIAWNFVSLAPSRAGDFFVKKDLSMAKRKRRPGRGSKLRPAKDYRDDAYVPYIFKAESGILQAWTVEPDLRDGDVRQALRSLIKISDQISGILTEEDEGSKESIGKILSDNRHALIKWLIITNLQDAVQEQGPLTAEDLAGILKVINNSVGTWNRGMRGQEYLKYIKDFLGGARVRVPQFSADEMKMLGLDQ